MDKICAVILAAGKGKRMHSQTPKVLQTILGEPMLQMVYENLEPIFGDEIYTVVGHGQDLIRNMFAHKKFVVQEEQLGTAHALKVALPVIQAQNYSHVFVINGDTPLVTQDLIRQFVEQALNVDLAVATLKLKDPLGYGRIVRKDGKLSAIIEAKDYDALQYGPPTGEINAGIYLFKLATLNELLPKVSVSFASGEYYLTELVHLALEANKQVLAIECGQDSRLLGVNSPEELVGLEEWLRDRIVCDLLAKGVLLYAKDQIRISRQATIEPGAVITGPCEIYGHSVVQANAKISSHCVIYDSKIASFAEIRSFSHLEQATVGEGCLVGPFARLRPGALLEQDAHVGNFVELKKTHLGQGAKANHLTYLGDADIGAHTNIGAGTITCNYDGHNKHKTTIGKNAFIGSNTALVAPVEVGEGALVGAGSTITHDVPAENLAVARTRQKNYPHKPILK